MIHGSTGEAGLMWAALKKCKDHFGSLALLMLFQLLLRLIALAPAVLGFAGVGEGVISGWLYYAMSMLMYVLLVMPFRFHAGQWLRYFAGEGLEKPDWKIPYGAWLVKGLLRLVRGLPWGIPVFAVMGYLVIGSAVLPYNRMWQPVQNLSLIFGMEPTLLNGIVAGTPLLLLMILIFCFGWMADLPAEYRIPGDGRWHGAARMKNAGRLLKNFCVNTLLFLPALAGMLAVIIPYIFGNVDFSGSVLKTIRDMTNLMDQPLPLEIAGMLAGILLLVYMPLCALRKMRNALLTDRMLGGRHAA